MRTVPAAAVIRGVGQAPELIHVRALRAFLVKGQRVEVGAVIAIERGTGMGLVTSGKALVVAAPAAAPAIKPEAAPAARRPRKVED